MKSPKTKEYPESRIAYDIPKNDTWHMGWKKIALPKTNTAPENGWLGDDSFLEGLFSGATLVLGRLYCSLIAIIICGGTEHYL